MYQCIISKLTNVRPLQGADRLKLANCLGSQVIVGLDSQEEDVVLFFDTDGQLSEEYCKANDLISYVDEEGNKKGGYFDHKRRVRAQTLRKAKSEAYVAPLSSLNFTGIDISTLNIGDRFNEINGIHICNKYYTPATIRAAKGNGPNIQSGYNKAALKKFFPEHTDTEQLRFARDEELIGLVILTGKYHGTSARTGYVQFPVAKPFKWYHKTWNKYVDIVDKVFRFPWANKDLEHNSKFHIEYENKFQKVQGTRRVVKGQVKDDFQDYRSNCSRILLPAIEKGEIWYYEIVGYEDTCAPIMQTVSTSEMPKDFQKRFGEAITYKYGCLPGTCEIYVYRITHRNEDGIIYELPWAQVKNKCIKAGIKHVPEIQTLLIKEDQVNMLKQTVEYYTEEIDIAEPIDESHIREGVCIRIENQETGKVKIFKNKTFAFKVLEGIAKTNDNSIDEEELESLEGE